MSNAIEVKGLKKSYGSFQAVKGVDFHVKKGQLFAFLGPNGAGKSTTINTICTLNKFDEGEVTVAGYDLKKESEKITSKIGIVFQESLLDKRLTIKENLDIRAGFYYSSKSEKTRAIESAIEYTDLKDILNKEYGHLSGGQRRRADIARALLNTPEILFLDEPTTGLDPQTRKYVWETIYKLQKDNNMTIFLTTHYMEEAAEAEYIVIIDHGEIVAQGTPYELKTEYSFDHSRIIPKENNVKEVIDYFDKHNMKWKEKDGIYDVRVDSTLSSLDMLSEIKDKIDNFEVLNGTMDDVFLNITGKDLRS